MANYNSGGRRFVVAAIAVAERLPEESFRYRLYPMADIDDIDSSGIDPELLENPLFQELMEEGLAIQDRFSAEPVYAKTDKGYLKGTGVEEIQKVKEGEKAKRESDSKGY